VEKMKTLTKFVSLALIASGALFAGGAFVPAPEAPDAEPVEPAVAEIPEAPAAEEIKPYFGGAIGSSTAKVNSSAKVCGECRYDKLNQTSYKGVDKTLNWGGSGDATTATALAGVEINDFLAVEGRLTKTISDYEIKDHKPISLTNAALYLKPQYKFEAASIYALLGYGISKVDFMDKTTTVNGFQYGAGASYDWNDELSIFADYTKLVGSSKKISKATKLDSIGSFNAGVIFRP
jgi:opacity protein-like surface antigen